MSASPPKPSLCVFTANADHILTASAARQGINVHSYSCEPWPGYVTGKLKRGVDFLSSRYETYAMWVDGTDTIINKTTQRIISRYQMLCAYNPDIVVISAERNCFPDAFAARYYPGYSPTMTTPQFICAGGFIGKRTQLIKLMQTVIQVAAEDNGNEDDQRAWTTAYIRYFSRSSHGSSLVLDCNRRIFSNAGDGVIEPETCVIHWNGRTPGREEYWRDLQSD